MIMALILIIMISLFATFFDDFCEVYKRNNNNAFSVDYNHSDH